MFYFGNHSVIGKVVKSLLELSGPICVVTVVDIANLIPFCIVLVQRPMSSQYIKSILGDGLSVQ